MERTIKNQDDEMMDFESELDQININTNQTQSEFINFHSHSDNSFKIKGSYDINQMTNNENHSLLKIKMNNNMLNEFALINSNFEVLYMSLNDESVFHMNTLKKEHTERINDLAFFKNSSETFSKALITGSSDGTMKIWDSRMKDSAKTISVGKGKKVFTLDTNENIIVAGMEREIGIWDLKMMKQTHKVKFAHSEDVTFVKLRNNNLLTGGEDSIVNLFDLTNGFDMDSIISQANLCQPVGSLQYLDDECNFILAITLVQTCHIFNTFTGSSVFEFNAKNDTFKSDYLLEGYFNKEKNNIDLFCGNNFGDIVLLNVDTSSKDVKIRFDSLIPTNHVQNFNSMDKLSLYDNHFVFVSDEGILTIINKKSELEKASDSMKELIMLDENNEEMSDNTNDTIKNDSSSKTQSSGNKSNQTKKKSNINYNKFSPY